jgi:hypothetical protein
MFYIAIGLIPIGFIADTFQNDRFCSDRFQTDTFYSDTFCLGAVSQRVLYTATILFSPANRLFSFCKWLLEVKISEHCKHLSSLKNKLLCLRRQ